jgi:uncharacterized protein
MRHCSVKLFGLSLLLVGVMPAPADTESGLAAFKNKDYQTAYTEWKAAAEAGRAEAQFDLGVLYAHGWGVFRDMTEASHWYRKSAEQGYAAAQFALGQMYSRGWGVSRDEADALICFQMANSGDSADADDPLPDWENVEGYGMPQDPERAAYWYRQAADQGYPRAQFNLGRMYAGGRGVMKDEEQAARWMSASAAQGYVPAMVNFGERYAAGNGVAKSDRRAYFWLTLALLHGDKDGQKIRAAAATKLNPPDLHAEDRAVQNWKPRPDELERRTAETRK